MGTARQPPSASAGHLHFVAACFMPLLQVSKNNFRNKLNRSSCAHPYPSPCACLGIVLPGAGRALLGGRMLVRGQQQCPASARGKNRPDAADTPELGVRGLLPQDIGGNTVL